MFKINRKGSFVMLNLESCQKCYISRNILWNPPRELQFKVVCKALTRHVVKIDVEKLHLIFSLLSLGHFMGWILCDIYLCPFQSLWVILFTGQIRDQIFVVNNSRIRRENFYRGKENHGLTLLRDINVNVGGLLCFFKVTQTFCLPMIR